MQSYFNTKTKEEAFSLFRERKFDEALKIYRTIKNPDIYTSIKIAKCYFGKKDFDIALNILYPLCKKEMGERERDTLYKAIIECLHFRYGKKNALSKNPSNDDLLEAREYLLICTIHDDYYHQLCAFNYFKDGDFEQSERHNAQITKSKNVNIAAHAKVQNTLLTEDKNNIDVAELYLTFKQIQNNSKKITLLKTILNIDPSIIQIEDIDFQLDELDDDSLLKLAKLNEKIHNTDKAEEIYLKLISRSPNFWQARIDYAYFLNTLNDKKQHEEAIEIVKPILENKKKESEQFRPPTEKNIISALTTTAYAYSLLKNSTKVVECWERCQQLDPKNSRMNAIYAKHVSTEKAAILYAENRENDKSRFYRLHKMPKQANPNVFIERRSKDFVFEAQEFPELNSTSTLPEKEKTSPPQIATGDDKPVTHPAVPRTWNIPTVKVSLQEIMKEEENKMNQDTTPSSNVLKEEIKEEIKEEKIKRKRPNEKQRKKLKAKTAAVTDAPHIPETQITTKLELGPDPQQEVMQPQIKNEDKPLDMTPAKASIDAHPKKSICTSYCALFTGAIVTAAIATTYAIKHGMGNN